MRRTFAATVVALALSASVLVAPVSSADDARSPVPMPVPTPDATLAAAQTADRALSRAVAVLDGTGDDRVSPTMALRDLFVALPSLSPAERKRANGILARPTQGDNDPNGDGYTVPARTDCSERICMHWVPTTADAPPSRSWVSRNMRVMKKTWAKEVGGLDYRPPIKDGDRGGNQKFDVYLKDVGADGYYGYCAPERRKRGYKWLASGYCVLDDDFARDQFGAKPLSSLRVTAAHEFFHAIQFAYDYGEDRWLMEASATWMEERVADDVDDNRQYLRHGQVSEPADPLDFFDPSGFDQYGNWAFFEHLSERFGTGIVRSIWSRAGAYRGAPDLYSTQAVRRSLPQKQSWVEVFRAYAAANTIPGRSYTEGRAWPSAPMVAAVRLGPSRSAAGDTVQIDHMASKSIVVRPGDRLRDRGWTLRISVDGPRRRTGPAAYVLVHRTDGTMARRPIRLDRDGAGRTGFRFTARSVKRATLTLANTSTRFNCWEQETTYSCQGLPKDNRKQFGYAVKVFRR